MTDFWEMMGCFVMDEDFREELFGTFKAGDIYKVGAKQRAAIPADRSTVGSASQMDDYETIRRIVWRHMGHKPLSLMALGTMLYSLTFADFRKRASALADLLDDEEIEPMDDGFYVALGALIVDRNLITLLASGSAWTKWGFGFVHRRDRRVLTELFDPNKNLKIANAAHRFCYSQWGSECDVSAVEWVDHTHPVTTLHRAKVVK